MSASDRVGLLYSIARVLAHHEINLQLAKITTLGERVEDTFLIDGPEPAEQPHTAGDRDAVDGGAGLNQRPR
jgi:UTP:GlnB (protein PII) uridylyltransferase